MNTKKSREAAHHIFGQVYILDEKASDAVLFTSWHTVARTKSTRNVDEPDAHASSLTSSGRKKTPYCTWRETDRLLRLGNRDMSP